MGFGTIDFVIVAVYLVAMTALGLRFGKSQHSITDYFLGGRDIPWWAVTLSIVATETSTLTVIGTPGIAYASDFQFIQLVVGYALARIIISIFFLPAYFRGEIFTVYQILQTRFGGKVKSLTSALFLVTRSLADSVRVFAVSLVVALVIKTGDVASVLVICALTLVYTFHGGMRAVIWTDVAQLGIYLGGSLVTAAVLLARIPGGWTEVAATAGGKFHFLDFSFSLTDSYTFWAGIFGGTCLTMATHGTDQLMVQRLLSARNLRESRLALIASGALVLFQFLLFLFIGVLLFVFYQRFPPTTPFTGSTDAIFPRFFVTQLPPGLGGLMVAAVFAAAMSTLSSSLNSLASTTLIDFYKPVFKTSVDELRLSRLFTVGWGVILSFLAVFTNRAESTLVLGLTIASFTAGPMLGIFLLALFSKKVTENDGLIGMICGLSTMVAVRWLTPIAWSWYVLIGAAATVGAGMLFNWVRKVRRKSVFPF